MPEVERENHGLGKDEIVSLIVDILKNGDAEERVFIGANLPYLTFDHLDIEGENQYPIDLRHTTIDGFSAEASRFEEQIDLRHSTIGEINLDDAKIEQGILCADSRVIGYTNLHEATTIGDNTDFSHTVFEGDVIIDEADFNDDVNFEQAHFQGKTSFKGTQLYGKANSIGDNTTFNGATFRGPTSFYQATLEYTSFEDVTFKEDVRFDKATANGSVLFTNVTFEGEAKFDEATFHEDTSFDNAVFQNKAAFRGVEFKGGAALLDDDVTFEGVVFKGKTHFDRANFRFANFTDTSFMEELDMERSQFEDDCIFERAEFHDTVDFDEVLFNGDANFSSCTFHQNAIFRGAEFHGGTNHLEDDAIFTNAVFIKNADFRDSLFTSANFMETKFQGDANFTDAEFTDALHFKAASFGDDTYINFTEATIPDGEITQPEEGWVRIDFTKATIGTVKITATTPTDKRELLDYFRFCNTTFDEFDFSEHTLYLDRNDWNLHGFNKGTINEEFELEMTPEVVEKTYLKAKKSASAESNIKAAGEFRVKRQQAARDKFYKITKDNTESIQTRFQNALRAGENLMLGVSCGYGLRLYRITTVFILFPLMSAVLFTFGGDLFETGAGQAALTDAFTMGGLEALGMNLYFSYITFLTIGYGNIAPVGQAARFISPALVYANVILGGLFLYALIKRSEV